MARLPKIHEELQNILRKTEQSIRQLPKPPSSDPLGEILHLIGRFNRDLSRHIEGTSDEAGLLQTIRPAQLCFRREIRLSAPDFKPFERQHAGGRTLPVITFLANEEEGDNGDVTGIQTFNTSDVIYIDEVFKRAQMCVNTSLLYAE